MSHHKPEHNGTDQSHRCNQTALPYRAKGRHARREARPWQGTQYIFISEPQFWVNLNKLNGWENVNLSVGGEVELSANFVAKGFHALPAFGAKWTF